jgi:hypothetical protein
MSRSAKGRPRFFGFAALEGVGKTPPRKIAMYASNVSLLAVSRNGGKPNVSSAESAVS